jgi:crossover junction endodeoxyribonuclease RusA
MRIVPSPLKRVVQDFDAMKQETARATGVNLKLTLPLAPGVNRQYATVGKRRVLTAPAKAFNRDVRKRIERARLDCSITLEMERALQTSLLGIYLTYFFETPHRRDLDGPLKITLDALCSALGLDDRTVVDLHLAKQIDPLHPRVEVEIDAISNWSFDRSYIYLGEQIEEPESAPDDGPR